MKDLIVRLAYGASDFGSQRGQGVGLALPVKALDSQGSVLAEGAASSENPVTLALPDTTELAFVRLTWPSGRSETQRISLENRPQAEVTFSDSAISSNEWSAWAIPKLNPKTPLAMAHGDVDLGLDRFDKVWLRLWRFSQDTWTQEKLTPEATYRNDAAWQLDLFLGPFVWLLQVGGSNVIWRFVSLPGGGPARVLITPKDSTDPRADALKVIVTSFRADGETLLEFLARDSMRAANALAGSKAIAQQLFTDKFEDPVSAVAGAYYLLRVGAWQRVPLWWYENLSQQFGWLPDAAVIHCVRLLREGIDTEASAVRAENLFVQCLERGWPVYAEGIALLQEAAGALRDAVDRSDGTLFSQVQALGAAKAWAGAAASFYGRSPNAPSALQWVGMPRAPRRRRLDPALRATSPRSPDVGVRPGFTETAPKRFQPEFPATQPRQILTLQTPSNEEFLLGSIKDRSIQALRVAHDAAEEGLWQQLAISVIGETGSNPRLLFSAYGELARVEMSIAIPLQDMECFIHSLISTEQDPEQIGRSLFELLVPNRLMDLIPNRRRMQLIVDKRAAAFPWELLRDRASKYDGDANKPLSVRSGLVRQLSTVNFRDNVQRPTRSTALVVGDPRLGEWATLFHPLDGAANEAEQIYGQLKDAGFEAVRQIRAAAPQILTDLFRDDWRVLHLSGHGVYLEDLPATARIAARPRATGMVIGDGDLLTTAHIAQMRVVPDFVFINCCSLGRIEGEGALPDGARPGDPKLAANLATELIEMGVHCVIAAGWKVLDAAALLFAQTFYERFLAGICFGEAVLAAREASFEQYASSNTWGAYQCYGNPGFVLRASAATRLTFARSE